MQLPPGIYSKFQLINFSSTFGQIATAYRIEKVLLKLLGISTYIFSEVIS